MTRLAVEPSRYRLLFQTAHHEEYPGDLIDPAWLEPARAQIRFDAQRAGLIGPDAYEVAVSEEPVFVAAETAEISAIRFAVTRDGRAVGRVYDIDSLFGRAAAAAALKLGKAIADTTGGRVGYRVVAEPHPPPSAGPNAVVTRKPLPLGEARLEDWLVRAERVGPEGDEYPLFITEQALDTTRVYLFKAGAAQLEGAALLLGHLYRQHEPRPEIFGVIDAVIELRQGSQERFSLKPTAALYADLQAQMLRRRTRLNRPDEIPLALAHNHPFLPSVGDNGEANCPSCQKRATCNLTSSFYSTSDIELHASLFAAQPYVAGMVWGFSPREELDVRVFALRGWRAVERGYYRLK
ncbi:MAG: hypothetical protein KJZ87_25175 [Thermoguttaceae bacterium]|nr:hypothetical protein [Thermoguttaceae bacterium]